MAEPMIYSYTTFEDAQAARAALIAGGLDPASAELQVIADEAGTVEGNFLVGDGRDARTGHESDAPPYGENFVPVTRGLHLLMVAPNDDAERARVVEMLKQTPGIDAAAAGDKAGNRAANRKAGADV